jgi:hypothetical protein
MAWTQSDADALQAAIGRGTKRVRFKDREVEYHNLSEMRALLADMNQEIAAAAGRPSFVLASTSKGFDICHD